MEFTKELPSEYSINDNLDEEIEEYIENIRDQNNKKLNLGLTYYQIKNLADVSTRKEVLDDLKKKGLIANSLSRKNSELPSPELKRAFYEKSSIFKIAPEDILISNKNFDILRLSMSCSCILGLAAFGSAAITYDLEYSDQSFDATYSA